MLDTGHVYELRIPKAGRHRTVAGYFDDIALLANAAAQWDGKAAGIYVTLNPVNPALIARAANRAKPYADTTTSDADVFRRQRLLVDVDPKRPSGIASTDAEHQAAIEKARRIREALRGMGWPEPLLIDSGNGSYLIYAIDLLNSPQALILVNGVLAALKGMFEDDAVTIDTTVGNAARIVRIPGTLNAKGDSTAERPHRRARILEGPERLDAVREDLLREVSLLGAEPAPEELKRANGSGRFDLADFMARHGLEVHREKRLDNGRVLELVTCPFDSAHTGGSAAIFEQADGKLGFRCHHNGCNGRGWRALRDHLEPGRAEGATGAAHETPKSDPPADAPPVDLPELLGEMEKLLRCYVAFASDAQVVAVVLWIVHTHIFLQFDSTPYLAITSPEKRSGKSRLLDVLELVVARAWRAVLPSEAVVFRKIAADAPTLLLDEIDAIYGPKAARDHEGLRALLNAGHRRGSKVPRCVGKDFQLVEFETYCPKALAGIGKLPDTVADRSIPIRLARRKRSEAVERFRSRAARAASAPLREQIERWGRAASLREARPALPDELDDRAADGWEPLLAIADAAGAGWPQRARQAAIDLHSDLDPESGTLGVRLLSDCREAFGQEAELFTTELIARLIALEAAPWAELPGRGGRKPLDARSLASLLRPYGIKSVNIRGGIEQQLKGYKAAAFSDAWARYISETASDPSHRPNESKDEPDQEVGAGRMFDSGTSTPDDPSQEKPSGDRNLADLGRWDGSGVPEGNADAWIAQRTAEWLAHLRRENPDADSDQARLLALDDLAVERASARAAVSD